MPNIQNIITVCDNCAAVQDWDFITAHLCSVASLTGANGTTEQAETVEGIEKYIPRDVLYTLGWDDRHPYTLARTKCDGCDAPITGDEGHLFTVWH